MAHTRPAAKIAFVKTGWSDWYQGGPVSGRHGYLRHSGAGHERFNFMPVPNGLYYGYLPPIGRQERPPQPSDLSNWLLVFVAARDGSGPLTIVGWYENAVFSREYIPRPEYQETGFETDDDGNQYLYCVSSDRVLLIPLELRTTTIDGSHFRRAPIIYARGGQRSEPWRGALAAVAEDMLTRFTFVDANLVLQNASAEHGREVEGQAIDRARRHLTELGYSVLDRTE
jgi:hypothetical protein